MNKPTWHRLFLKWAKRLLPETHWKCKSIADPNLESNLISAVIHKPEYRTATFHYRPGTAPDNSTACHEVVHLLVARLAMVADKLAEDQGDVAKAWIETATEETVEEITNVFLRAYGEADD